MRQYDLCRNTGKGAARAPYLLVIQRDSVSALPTRLVAPVMRLSPTEVVTRVMVPVEVGGDQLYIVVSELFAISRTALGTVEGNVAELHDDIVRALDFLVTG